MITHTLNTYERISLATAIFSDDNQAEMVKNLSGDDAQGFIDVLDEVSLRILPGTDKLTSTRTSAPCRLGVGQSSTTDPKKIPAHYIQHL